mmetsp:Transcript_93302/g.266905  ORF Transcript_93302/g.266905 Transcript_93302/m.266905 type:complete len:105 (+) Transcript_93302:210-524(+)
MRARFSAGVQRAFRAAAFRRFREEGEGYMGGGGGRGRSQVPDVTLGGEEDFENVNLAMLASDDLRLPLVPLLRLRLWRIGNRCADADADAGIRTRTGAASFQLS